jgi:hypothetical protein
MYQGDYIPSAPINDEARKRNQNLPGMGGVYNYINFHVYHYGGNNPTRYTDPDGRLLRDDDGVIIFDPVGEIEIFPHEPTGRSAMVQHGYIYADDGTRIEATSTRDVADPGFDTNCHGFSFAEGRFWIEPDQVQKLLKGDGYENVFEPRAGDIVVYYESKYSSETFTRRSEAAHSAVVVNVRRGGGLFSQRDRTLSVEVEAIGGVTTEPKRTSVESGWDGHSSYAFYRKR